MLVERYRVFAAYNAWANRRLYAAAALLPDAEYRADKGAFFKSVHGTLNHVLVGDRAWMRRLTGAGPVVPRLDTILFDSLADLEAARIAEDARIEGYIASLNDADLGAELRYANASGASFAQPVWTVLDHVFNHQTHHRGQTHCLISGCLDNAATPSLDLIVYQREKGIAHAQHA